MSRFTGEDVRVPTNLRANQVVALLFFAIFCSLFAFLGGLRYAIERTKPSRATLRCNAVSTELDDFDAKIVARCSR